MRLVGDPELGARLVPALAALGLVAITVWFGAVMVSRDVGIVAGLMLAACPGVFGLARYAILDTLFTMFMFGGAACLAVAALRDRPRLQWLGYVAIALGVQTKGPIALVLCGLTMLLLMALSADLRRRLLALHWALGLVIIAALSAPWFVYMYVRFRDGFVNGYVLDENLRLFAGSRFANQPGFWFYFQILAAGAAAVDRAAHRPPDRRCARVDARRAARRRRDDALGLDAGGRRLLHASRPSSSITTCFPAAPALCLLCARAWSDVRADQMAPRNRASRVGLYLIGPFLVAVGVGCGYFLIARLELPRGAVMVPIALTLAGAVLAALANVRRRAAAASARGS